MKLQKNSAVQVILPKKPTSREQFAAGELKKYLQKIFKHIKVDEKSESVFIIGGPGRNEAARELIRKEEFSSLLTGEEGILIRIRGNKILIAGSEGFEDWERGTVYAVYEFLERYLGCSLASYCAPDVDAGEHVPVLEELDLADDQYVKSGSDRPYRCGLVQYGDQAGNPDHGLNVTFLDWMIKNRYNGASVWSKIYEGWKRLGLIPEFEKRGIQLTVGHHDSVRLWLPFDGNDYFPEKYTVTHPEYYRLNEDGTRFRPRSKDDAYGQWVFCSRNEACIQQVSENIIHWLTENPIVRNITLWPMDGTFEQCCCPMCKPYSKVENYAYFLNEVAIRVAQVHPLVQMELLLYTNLWEHPDGLKLSKNLTCGMATWAATGLRCCGKPDGSCLVNTHYTDTLMKWKENGSEVLFYDYYMGVFGCRQRLIPMADELQAIWKYHKEHGILGIATQMECFHIWNHLVNLYCFGRTGYDNTRSLEDNLSLLTKIFGEGAPYITKYVLLAEEIMDGQKPIRWAPDYLMENIDRDLVYGWFDEALAAASTARFRNNIRLMRMVFRYSDLEFHDPGHSQPFSWLLHYEDPTGELAYMATEFDSFEHNHVGYGIAFPLSNTDIKGFQPDKWYQFE